MKDSPPAPAPEPIQTPALHAEDPPWAGRKDCEDCERPTPMSKREIWRDSDRVIAVCLLCKNIRLRKAKAEEKLKL